MGANRTVKERFLVAYDYGMGAVWAYIYARSKQQIQREYPELEVVSDPPRSMTRELLSRIEKRMTFDIDAPTGWLAELRKRRSR